MTAAEEKTTKRWRQLSPPAVISALLAIATFTLFARAIGFDFINFDDPEYFYNNPEVLAGFSLHGVKWAFSSHAFGVWQPLTWISFMVDASLFGGRPLGPHLTNICLHTANVVLVFHFLNRLTRRTWCSALVAALFGLHPLRVESVAWVTERKDVLSLFFGLLAFLSYIRYVNTLAPGKSALKNRAYWLTALWFTLSLLSKPMFVTFPFVLLLLDFWPLQRMPGRPLTQRTQLILLGAEKIPFLLLGTAVCVITILVTRESGALGDLAWVPWRTRLAGVFVSYAQYVGKTFWPVDLVMPYSRVAGWTPEVVGSCATLIIGLSVAAFWLIRQRPYFFVGWYWFLGTLITVIGLIQWGGQAIADRFTYLPSLGLFVFLVWLAADCAERWKISPRLCTVVAVLVLSVCSACTAHQLAYWRDSRTLFSHTLDIDPSNITAHHRLASVLSEQGQLTDGLAHYEAILRLTPDFGEVQCLAADTLVRLGRLEEGVTYYRQVVSSQTNLFEAMNNLAWLLATCSDEKLRNGSEAIQLAERACVLSANKKPVIIGTLAAAYAEAGRFEDAIKTAERAAAVATDQGQSEVAERNRQLLELYRNGKPYHEESSTPGTTTP